MFSCDRLLAKVSALIKYFLTKKIFHLKMATAGEADTFIRDKRK